MPRGSHLPGHCGLVFCTQLVVFPMVLSLVGASFPGSHILTSDAMVALHAVRMWLSCLVGRAHPGTRLHLCASLLRLLAGIWVPSAGHCGRRGGQQPAVFFFK